MSKWVDILSEWSGIDPGSLSILLVFVLVVAVIVVAFIVIALFLVFRPTPDERVEKERQRERHAE